MHYNFYNNIKYNVDIMVIITENQLEYYIFDLQGKKMKLNQFEIIKKN